MAEKLNYNSREPEEYEEAEAESNGWTDAEDPDVKALRNELRQLDSRLLQQLGAGLSTANHGAEPRLAEQMNSYLHEGMDYVCQAGLCTDSQSAANAAAWAVFKGLREDLESGNNFTIPDKIGPSERHLLQTFMTRSQLDYAAALGKAASGEDSDDRHRKAAVEAMNEAADNAITAARGDIDMVQDIQNRRLRE